MQGWEAVSSRLRQRRLCPGQPERHIHGTVQLNGGGQFNTGLLWPSQLEVQGTEAQVAVRLERAHAQLLGQGEGLAVVAGGGLALGGLLARRALAQEPQGPGLVAALLVLAGEVESLCGALVCVSQATSQ